MWLRSTDPTCAYLRLSFRVTERETCETRPVSIAYIITASRRLAAVLFGKLVVSKMPVVPELMGSLAGTPVVVFANVTEENTAAPSDCCQLLTLVKVAPKFRTCVDFAQVKLSVRVVTGVFRRDCVLARYGFWT